MKTLRNILLSLFGLLLLAAALLAAWITWRFDLNAYREDIQALLEERTGLEVELAGEIELYMLHGLHVSIRDVHALAQGQPLASIDRLQLQIALYPLLDHVLDIKRLDLDVARLNALRDPKGRFNFLPMTKDGPSNHSPATSLLVWFDTVHIDKLNIQLSEVRYLDLGRELDLHVQQARLELEQLPVIQHADLLLDDPSWVMSHSQRVSLRVHKLGLNALQLMELELTLKNREGQIEIKHLQAKMGMGKPGDPMRQSMSVEGGGRLSLGFDEPRSELPRTDWNAIDRMDLSELDFQVVRLQAGTGGARLELDDGRLKIKHLPLLAGEGQPAVSLADLLAKQDLVFELSGDRLRMGRVQLKPFDLRLRTDRQGLEIQAQQTGLQLDAGWENVRKFTTEISGKALLGTGAGKPGRFPPAELRLLNLELQALGGDLDTPKGLYGFKQLQLRAADIPLLIDGKPADWNAPRVLALHAPGLRLELSASGMHHGAETVESATLNLARQGDRVEFKQLEARLANTSLSGSGEIDLEQTPSHWRIDLHSPRVALAPLLAFFNARYQAQGDLSLDLDISGRGFKTDGLAPSLNGSLLMTGKEFLAEGIDLDAIITHLEKSQSVGLLDVGAYALAGPAGALLTKGTDYAALIDSTKHKGRTRLIAMHSELAIENGELKPRDVAVSTAEHRIAVKGSLDLKADGPLALEIATLNDQGCPIYVEQISGTLEKPKVSQAGVLIKGIINPIKSVLGGLADMVTGECAEPFYTGRLGQGAGKP